MDQTIWRDRIIQRSDMTGRITHLTKGISDDEAFNVLWEIIVSKKIIASNGYVKGNQKVVCFQETPLESLEENLFFETQLAEKNRYLAFGLRFNKGSMYAKGTRPVIYGDEQEIKSIYWPEISWRVVEHNLNCSNKIVDWTHEREWRHLGDVEFEYNEIEILVKDQEYYKKFVTRCFEQNREDILKEINGIIPLFSVVG